MFLTPSIDLILGAALSVALVASAPLGAKSPPPVPSDPPLRTCASPEVIDGDTIKCGAGADRFSVRLIGIDAPELPGHCRKGRICAPGDPRASRAALASWLGTRGVRWQSFGTDRYGRSLGIVRRRDGENASCGQLAAGQAIFKPAWDKQGRIARECGQ